MAGLKAPKPDFTATIAHVRKLELAYGFTDEAKAHVGKVVQTFRCEQKVLTTQPASVNGERREWILSNVPDPLVTAAYPSIQWLVEQGLLTFKVHGTTMRSFGSDGPGGTFHELRFRPTDNLVTLFAATPP